MEGEEGEAGVEAPLVLHLLCWEQKEREAEGRPWCDVGLMVAGEAERWRSSGSSRAAPLEEGQGGAEEEAVHWLGPLKEEEEAKLHGMEAVGVGGRFVGSGPGWEAGGPSDPVEVEGLEWRDWSPAQEAAAHVYQVEEVGVHQLWCSTKKKRG